MFQITLWSIPPLLAALVCVGAYLRARKMKRVPGMQALLALLAGSAMAFQGPPTRGFADQPSTGPLETFVPCRAITKGPKHHWFGYYDKLQFDPTSRYALGMAVDFEHRSPRGDDVRSTCSLR